MEIFRVPEELVHKKDWLEWKLKITMILVQHHSNVVIGFYIIVKQFEDYTFQERYWILVSARSFADLSVNCFVSEATK